MSSPAASNTNPHPPPPVAPPRGGWYQDPWDTGRWRWWDGRAWTARVTQRPNERPRLPDWLSVPVIMGSIPTIAALVYIGAAQPRAVGLSVVPLLIVFPAMVWLDRVEPEPMGARVHAVLWGILVAGILSGLINSIVAVMAGEGVAAVVSAPLVEEATKAAGVAWALRRGYVDGVMDGVVYAGWVGLGFAVVEDITYFAIADGEGILVETFVLRALVTPFAHPLFTVWTGLGVGLAVARGRSPVAYGLVGYLVAVITHGMWNGSLQVAEATASNQAVLVAGGFFLALFTSVVVALVILRRHQFTQFSTMVPMLASHYRIPLAEVEVFTDYRSILKARRVLSRPERRDFDSMHAALARLALLHRRPGQIDHGDQARLVDQLNRVRKVSTLRPS